MKTRKAQEEMVGFALIIILVAVILLVFLGFFVLNSESEESSNYEVESFIQAMLQKSTSCKDYSGPILIQELIFDCDRGQNCIDSRDSCEVLEEEIQELMENGWQIKGDRPIKGYSLNISSEDEEILGVFEGNKTNTVKGAMQDFSKSGNLISVKIDVYY